MQAQTKDNFVADFIVKPGLDELYLINCDPEADFAYVKMEMDQNQKQVFYKYEIYYKTKEVIQTIFFGNNGELRAEGILGLNYSSDKESKLVDAYWVIENQVIKMDDKVKNFIKENY